MKKQQAQPTAANTAAAADEMRASEGCMTIEAYHQGDRNFIVLCGAKIQVDDFRIIHSVNSEICTTEFRFKTTSDAFGLFCGINTYDADTLCGNEDADTLCGSEDEVKESDLMRGWTNRCGTISVGRVLCSPPLVVFNGTMIDADEFQFINSADGTTEFMMKITSNFAAGWKLKTTGDCQF